MIISRPEESGKVSSEGKLFYYDVNSLYPYIMSTALLPVGKPPRNKSAYVSWVYYTGTFSMYFKFGVFPFTNYNISLLALVSFCPPASGNTSSQKEFINLVRIRLSKNG